MEHHQAGMLDQIQILAKNHILLLRLPASAAPGKAARVQSKGWRAPGGGKVLHAQDTQSVHPREAAGTELLQAELQDGLKIPPLARLIPI